MMLNIRGTSLIRRDAEAFEMAYKKAVIRSKRPAIVWITNSLAARKIQITHLFDEWDPK